MTFVWFLVGVFALLLIELVLGGLSIIFIKWFNYIFRSNYDCNIYWDKKHKLLGKDFSKAQWGLFLCCIVGFLIILLILMAVDIVTKYAGGSFESLVAPVDYLWVVVLPVILSPLLRWLVDVSRNLRIKKEDGVSKELAELKEKVKKLEETDSKYTKSSL